MTDKSLKAQPTMTEEQVAEWERGLAEGAERWAPKGHGESVYLYDAIGCRCGPCRAFMRRYWRERKAARK